jgi:hypothetical protein
MAIISASSEPRGRNGARFAAGGSNELGESRHPPTHPRTHPSSPGVSVAHPPDLLSIFLNSLDLRRFCGCLDSWICDDFVGVWIPSYRTTSRSASRRRDSRIASSRCRCSKSGSSRSRSTIATHGATSRAVGTAALDAVCRKEGDRQHEPIPAQKEIDPTSRCRPRMR